MGKSCCQYNNCNCVPYPFVCQLSCAFLHLVYCVAAIHLVNSTFVLISARVHYFMIECWKMLVGHLSVWGWLLLLPSSLAQNHTCHRMESVEVTVAVPLQEPATFRSYTWCLKVPPRCSKYTVVMRERITYETEVRNQTVSECCAGYVSLYGECVSACTDCPNMHCDASHNCTCAPGYTGSFCNDTCVVGTWGDRCMETCICRVGEDCDPVSGSCTPSTSTITPSTTLSTSPSTASISDPSSSSNSVLPTTLLSHSVVSTPPEIGNPTESTPSPSSNFVLSTISHTIITKSPRTRNSMTTSTPDLIKHFGTTPNTFVNLTLKEPTTSSEDLSDFNVISRPRTNDTVRLVNNNNDVNSLNALGDLDYPILPTDSAVESFNYIQPDHEPTKNLVVNSLSVNNSIVNAQWISDLGTHSSVTLGSALGLLALIIVIVSVVIRCRNKKMEQHQASTTEKNSLHLVAKNSHYAVPGPPSFSFINAYEMDSTRGEDTYDHPRSARCLVANEPVYDELRY